MIVEKNIIITKAKNDLKFRKMLIYYGFMVLLPLRISEFWSSEVLPFFKEYSFSNYRKIGCFFFINDLNFLISLKLTFPEVFANVFRITVDDNGEVDLCSYKEYEDSNN